MCQRLIEGPGPKLQLGRPPLRCAEASWESSLYRLDVWCTCIPSIDVFAPRHCTKKPAKAVFCKPPALSGRYGRHSSQRIHVICAVQRLEQVRGRETSTTVCCNVKCTSLNLPAFPDRVKHLQYMHELLLKSTVICRKSNNVSQQRELYHLMVFHSDSRLEHHELLVKSCG